LQNNDSIRNGVGYTGLSSQPDDCTDQSTSVGPARSYSGRSLSHVSMPVGWRFYSIWNGIEIWDYPDGSEVHINPESHEAIWIRVRQEIKTAWPLLDSPMPYPSSDIPVKCETPDCTICALMNTARQIVIAVSRGNS
jgi:hypothetical protein